jgi:pimeloyl-ACP methyl ester carboxylesterase
MENIFIKNRNNKKLAVIVERPDNPIGLSFVMHGLGGNKNQPSIKIFSQALFDNNYIVVRFDAANTSGESEGNLEDANVTNYFEDLEDVINWSREQDWYQEPFILCGHSMGAMSVALYAEKFPDKVKALAPISVLISGKLISETHSPEELADWEKTGLRTWESSTQPGLIKKLKWSHVTDRLKYDLLTEINKLTMPTILIVGELDTSTPVKHQQIFFDRLPGKKELNIIKNAPHTFKEPEHLKEIYFLLDKWLKALK